MKTIFFFYLSWTDDQFSLDNDNNINPLIQMLAVANS